MPLLLYYFVCLSFLFLFVAHVCIGVCSARQAFQLNGKSCLISHRNYGYKLQGIFHPKAGKHPRWRETEAKQQKQTFSHWEFEWKERNNYFCFSICCSYRPSGRYIPNKMFSFLPISFPLLILLFEMFDLQQSIFWIFRNHGIFFCFCWKSTE